MSEQTRQRSLDELARGLASGSLSRRKALKLMGGLFVGSALGSIPGVAWADNNRCSEGRTRCGERCVNLKTNEHHCGSCHNRCGSNQTCCGGRCVNLQRSEHHCGSCSNHCAEGQECVDGVCGSPTSPPLPPPPPPQPICTPSCPDPCNCEDLWEGDSPVCVDCHNQSCNVVRSWADCPADKVCINGVGGFPSCATPPEGVEKSPRIGV